MTSLDEFLCMKFFGNMLTFEDKIVSFILTDIEYIEEDIKKKLEKLKPSKSHGPDGIYPRMLKELATVLA